MRLINVLGVCKDVHCAVVLEWSRCPFPGRMTSYEMQHGDFVRGHWDGEGIFYVQQFRSGSIEWDETANGVCNE